GQRNTHVALHDLTAQGYLASRPGAGTFVIRTPDGATPHSGTTSRSPARSLKGQRVAIVAHAPTDCSDTIRVVESRLNTAGVEFDHIHHKDPYLCDLTPYCRENIQ